MYATWSHQGSAPQLPMGTHIAGGELGEGDEPGEGAGLGDGSGSETGVGASVAGGLGMGTSPFSTTSASMQLLKISSCHSVWQAE